MGNTSRKAQKSAGQVAASDQYPDSSMDGNSSFFSVKSSLEDAPLFNGSDFISEHVIGQVESPQQLNVVNLHASFLAKFFHPTKIDGRSEPQPLYEIVKSHLWSTHSLEYVTMCALNILSILEVYAGCVPKDSDLTNQKAQIMHHVLDKLYDRISHWKSELCWHTGDESLCQSCHGCDVKKLVLKHIVLRNGCAEDTFCLICLDFFSKGNFAEHSQTNKHENVKLRLVNGMYPYSCSDCEQKFVSLTVLEQHRVWGHPPSVKNNDALGDGDGNLKFTPVCCYLCCIPFSDTNKLKEHELRSLEHGFRKEVAMEVALRNLHAYCEKRQSSSDVTAIISASPSNFLSELIHHSKIENPPDSMFLRNGEDVKSTTVTGFYYCNVCMAKVPRAGVIIHEKGRQHRENCKKWATCTEKCIQSLRGQTCDLDSNVCTEAFNSSDLTGLNNSGTINGNYCIDQNNQTPSTECEKSKSENGRKHKLQHSKMDEAVVKQSENQSRGVNTVESTSSASNSMVSNEDPDLKKNYLPNELCEKSYPNSVTLSNVSMDLSSKPIQSESRHNETEVSPASGRDGIEKEDCQEPNKESGQYDFQFKPTKNEEDFYCQPHVDVERVLNANETYQEQGLRQRKASECFDLGIHTAPVITADLIRKKLHEFLAFEEPIVNKESGSDEYYECELCYLRLKDTAMLNHIVGKSHMSKVESIDESTYVKKLSLLRFLMSDRLQEWEMFKGLNRKAYKDFVKLGSHLIKKSCSSTSECGFTKQGVNVSERSILLPNFNLLPMKATVPEVDVVSQSETIVIGYESGTSLLEEFHLICPDGNISDYEIQCGICGLSFTVYNVNGEEDIDFSFEMHVQNDPQHLLAAAVPVDRNPQSMAESTTTLGQSQVSKSVVFNPKGRSQVIAEVISLEQENIIMKGKTYCCKLCKSKLYWSSEAQFAHHLLSNDHLSEDWILDLSYNEISHRLNKLNSLLKYRYAQHHLLSAVGRINCLLAKYIPLCKGLLPVVSSSTKTSKYSVSISNLNAPRISATAADEESTFPTPRSDIVCQYCHRNLKAYRGKKRKQHMLICRMKANGESVHFCKVCSRYMTLKVKEAHELSKSHKKKLMLPHNASQNFTKN